MFFLGKAKHNVWEAPKISEKITNKVNTFSEVESNELHLLALL